MADTVKHTPGPWESNGGTVGAYIEGRHGYTHIAHVTEGGGASLPSEEAKANARLIAAAPKLLNALKQQLAYESAPSGEKRPNWMELAELRDEAIAAAEGR